ncbi:MAG: right-handed parallel beta-helix repeat-containing protein [Methanobacteriota archaeon]
MRRRASVRLLFLVLAVAPTLLSGFAPTAGAISYSARAPITITSDAGFTAANGVVSGSGTLLDPYVISGWHIVAATTPAIQIRDTSAHFVVRDTLVESTSWGLVVVDLSRTGANGTFGPGNVVHHRGTGVSVTDGSPRLHNNTVSGPRPTTGGYVRNAAVRLYASGSLVADNVLVRSDDGVFLDRATAVVRANTFHLDGTGVVASQDTDTTVDANQFTLMSDQAVRLSQSTRALVRANLVQGGAGGILASSSTLVTESNSFVGGSATAINATGSILTATGDVVSGGSGHGLHTSASSVVVTQFNASGLAGTGVRLESTTGNVTASVVTGSGGGIALSASTVRLTGNVLSNNSFGLSVPYDSRLSIPLASGNLVNGVNVDGSLVASDRRLFYLTWGITVDGEIVDSGVSAGFTGIAIREGGIVLYDTKDVNVTNSTFIEQNVGVYAVASRFVSVRFNLFLDNLCGVVFLETEGDVKNNTINFTIAPP